MSVHIVVLYEDSSNKGDVRNFGPHRFVQACLRDRLSGAPGPEVDAFVEGRPMKGNSRVLADLRAVESGAEVVAVLDGDRIRGALRLRDEATEDEIVTAIRERHGSARTHVVLLQHNVERLIAALRRCEADVSEDAMEAALRKRPNARDKVFQAAAWGSRRVRDCVQQEVPSFKRLVDLLDERVRRRFAPPGGPAA